jgi:hypothetical protein
MTITRAPAERAAWVCHACRLALGEIVLDATAPHLLLTTRQLTGRVNLPVRRDCPRCGTGNQLQSTDLERWQRRGGLGPVLAAWQPALLTRTA